MASSARLCTAKRLCVESARISSRPLAFLPPSRNFSCSTARGDEQRPTPGQAEREAQKTSDDNKRTDLQRVGAGQVPLAPNQRFDDGESRTALALRTYWRQTMPNFQFSSRNEFIDSYLKWSLIFLAMVLGVTLYRNYRALDAPEVVSNEWFTKLKLLSRTRVASDTLLLQLELPADALPPINADSPTDLDVPVQSIAIADPDSMIQRPYTPLFADVFDPTSPHHTGKLDILVKHYRDGEVSGYLHSLAVGSKVMVRGPVRTWRFRERDYDDLIFVVAGTGIAPAFQVISSLFEAPKLQDEANELLFSRQENTRIDRQNQAGEEQATSLFPWRDWFSSQTEPPSSPSSPLPPRTRPASRRSVPRITLIYASASTDSILLRNTLNGYANENQSSLRIAYFADQIAKPEHGERVVKEGKLGEAELTKYVGRPGQFVDPSRVGIIVCGPEGFIDGMAGPRTKGAALDVKVPLGGHLARLGWRADQIIRLDNGNHLSQSLHIRDLTRPAPAAAVREV